MEVLNNLLGLNGENPEPSQMGFRAIVIFFISLIFVRIAGIRTFGRQSAFDTLTSLMLGAIMGRAVVSNQSFFGSILATLIIMLLHRLVSWITFKSKKLGKVLKGESILLMQNGVKNESNLFKTFITEEDILEALRKDVNTTSPDKIKEVYLERSGDISIIK